MSHLKVTSINVLQGGKSRHGRRNIYPSYNILFCRSRGLRSGSTAACFLVLWVRISPKSWMSVCCECCVLSEFSASGWSLVQRSPTDCGSSACARPIGGCSLLIKKILLYAVRQKSAVGIKICYGLEGLWIESRLSRDFSHPFRLALVPTHPPVQRAPGLFPEGKEAGALHWPQTPI
jgi:hypothetical protein